MHVVDPSVVLDRMHRALGPGGFLVAQEPITSAGRVGGEVLSMPAARHPDLGALLPALVRDAELEITDAWAEAPAGAGPGPVSEYLRSLTEVDPGDDPVVLPPLVTVIGTRSLNLVPRAIARSRCPCSRHAWSAAIAFCRGRLTYTRSIRPRHRRSIQSDGARAMSDHGCRTSARRVRRPRHGAGRGLRPRACRRGRAHRRIGRRVRPAR